MGFLLPLAFHQTDPCLGASRRGRSRLAITRRSNGASVPSIGGSSPRPRSSPQPDGWRQPRFVPPDVPGPLRAPWRLLAAGLMTSGLVADTVMHLSPMPGLHATTLGESGPGSSLWALFATMIVWGWAGLLRRLTGCAATVDVGATRPGRRFASLLSSYVSERPAWGPSRLPVGRPRGVLEVRPGRCPDWVADVVAELRQPAGYRRNRQMILGAVIWSGRSPSRSCPHPRIASYEPSIPDDRPPQWSSGTDLLTNDRVSAI